MDYLDDIVARFNEMIEGEQKVAEAEIRSQKLEEDDEEEKKRKFYEANTGKEQEIYRPK